MIKNLHIFLLLVFASILLPEKVCTQSLKKESASQKECILAKMYLVNENFKDNAWKQNDRNWIRGTYYTGLMAFYQATKDSNLVYQAKTWAAKHGWRAGTEWTYPANRLTCTQTYLELFLLEGGSSKIENTKSFMDKRVVDDDPAEDQGWWYADALYVGIPAYMQMSKATGQSIYSEYGNRMFWEVKTNLFDVEEKLFYRDKKAKKEITDNGKKEIWSRGNGWAIASIPRILNNITENHPDRSKYEQLLKEMASTLVTRQREDGFWNVNLADPRYYPGPESSGTAFFVYAMAWGVNKNILDKEVYLPVISKAWEALYYAVDSEGKVCWGQGVSRDPGKVDKEDSAEFVSGAFLLAGSEVYKMILSL